MSEMKRNTYIENNDDEQALQDYLQALGDLQGTAEEISVLDAVGRITWQAIFARFCDPVYNASAMDGIAVIAEQTFSATETEPADVKARAGLCVCQHWQRNQTTVQCGDYDRTGIKA